jgi:hypothetical protein
MKCISLLILVLYSLEVDCQNEFENDSIIIWNISRKLTLNDFKKLKGNNIKSTIDNRKAFAYSNVSVFLNPSYINCEDLDEVIVYTIFNKNKSWKNKYLENGKYIKYDKNYLLNHEQIHFDISEIYVRKIRYLIKSMKNDCDFEVFKGKYYKLLKDLAVVQAKYDKQTKHSLDKIKQKKWNKKVDSLLREYKDYEMNVTLDDIGL